MHVAPAWPMRHYPLTVILGSAPRGRGRVDSHPAGDCVKGGTIVSQERLETMYRAHHQVIWRTLRRLGFSPEAAADYTQQAYLIALERIDDIFLGSEKAFLFSTAIRLGRTAARKLRRMDLSDELELRSDRGSGAAFTENRQAALQLLEQVLLHMDVDLVTVFTLYEIEGMSSPEIAEVLAIPVGTVASRLRRARETFREKAARLEKGTFRFSEERAATSGGENT
jgi:RNA polymerase sigma-70 factor, ECF subfamily